MSGQRLIGVTGHMGAGKDSVGAILVQLFGYQRVAFADRLKAIATDIGWDGEKGQKGRELLQKLGVAVREHLGEDTWVNAALISLDPFQRTVITDVRFPNEAAAIRAKGGVIWHVRRPGFVGDAHESEQHVADLALTASKTIHNTGELHDLARTVIDIMRPEPMTTGLTSWPDDWPNSTRKYVEDLHPYNHLAQAAWEEDLAYDARLDALRGDDC